MKTSHPVFPRLPMALFALLLSVVAGCQSGPAPKAEYVSFSEQLHESALKSTATINVDLNDYVALLGERIVEGARAANPSNTNDAVLAKMRFHLVASDTINAFGTGGGHIYVYNGLFKECQTEEELAAIMAQQFAHAVALDHQKTGLKPDPGLPPDLAARALFEFRFTLDQAREADAKGFEFYARAGWDPDRFYTLFERLGDRSPAPTNPDREPLSARAAAARERVGRLPAAARNWRKPNVADAGTFRALRDKAARFSEPPGAPSRPLLYLRVFPNNVLPGDSPEQRAAQEQLRIETTPKATDRGPIEAS